MRTSWSLPAFAIAALLATAGPAFAQMATPPASAAVYETCREQAIARGLAGDARGTAISQCMATATANPAAGGAHAMYEACRDQAITRGLAGEARVTAINECVSVATIEPAAGRTPYSLDTCRSGAIARGLSGEALGQFVDRCTKGQ